MNYFFQLRKDSSNQYNQLLLINSITAIKKEQRYGKISRNDIKTLQLETNIIKNAVENKLDKSEIRNILKLIQDAQQKAISDINLVREQFIQELTILNIKSEESADKSAFQARQSEESQKAAALSATASATSAVHAALDLEKSRYQARLAQESANLVPQNLNPLRRQWFNKPNSRFGNC